MEDSLTPMQKAYRKFLSGKPPAMPKNTPLGAVSLATEQRQRLQRILSDAEVKHARITSMAVVLRFLHPTQNALADTVLVEEGKEGTAIATLERYGKTKRPFVICGLQFAVQGDYEKRFFAYPIERTPEGETALLWSCQRQSSGEVRKRTN